MLACRQLENEQNMNHRMSRNPVVIFSGPCWPAGNWRAKKRLTTGFAEILWLSSQGHVGLPATGERKKINHRIFRNPVVIFSAAGGLQPDLGVHGEIDLLCVRRLYCFRHGYRPIPACSRGINTLPQVVMLSAPPFVACPSAPLCAGGVPRSIGRC